MCTRAVWSRDGDQDFVVVVHTGGTSFVCEVYIALPQEFDSLPIPDFCKAVSLSTGVFSTSLPGHCTFSILSLSLT